jgi:hypothetical protein
MRKWRIIVPLLIAGVLAFALLSGPRTIKPPAFEFHSVTFYPTNENGRACIGVLFAFGSESGEGLAAVGGMKRVLMPNGWMTNRIIYSGSVELVGFEMDGVPDEISAEASRWQLGYIVCEESVRKHFRRKWNAGWRWWAFNAISPLLSDEDGKEEFMMWGPQFDQVSWMQWHPFETIYPKIPFRAIVPERDCR